MYNRDDRIQYFFTDLDCTLIYSHKYNPDGDIKIIEYIDNKEQAFILRSTMRYLQQADWLDVVPVTTRAKRQYDRLAFLQRDLGCRKALICNGGILIENGKVDEDWLRTTIEIAEVQLAELPRAKTVLCSIMEEKEVHSADDLFLYTVSEKSDYIKSFLQSNVDTNLVDVIQSGRKVYCIPKSINKGAAIKRYKEKYGERPSIAAGDSIFDIPMLEYADTALVPKKIEKQVLNSRKIILEETPIISDEICRGLEELGLTT